MEILAGKSYSSGLRLPARRLSIVSFHDEASRSKRPVENGNLVSNGQGWLVDSQRDELID